MPSPTFAPPTPLATPTPARTAIPTPVPAPTLPVFAGAVAATSCDASLVPGTVVPVSDPSPSPAVQELKLHVPILEYHRVVPLDKAGRSMPGLTMPPEIFRAQMDALFEAGWHTITLATLAEDLDTGVVPARHSFVITIDDGYRDSFDYAFPILFDHGYVATFFVIADRIGRDSFMGADLIRALAGAGNEIGDHTWHHDALTALGPKPLASEIDSGAATIAAITGRWPVTLAYPRGRFNATVMAAAEGCKSIKMAVTEGGGGREIWANRFRIARIEIGAFRSADSMLAQVTADGV
jgi:peptidoglycan/xylan/chitin deacetylase (PgdA/CDA1 family)